MLTRFDYDQLDTLKTAEQIDQFLADHHESSTSPLKGEYDEEDSWGMKIEEFHALEFVYRHFTDAIFRMTPNESFLEFIKRYDQTHPDRTYVYYPAPTITPEVVQTTLQQVVIDCVMFDADPDEYWVGLRNLIKADFAIISAHAI